MKLKLFGLTAVSVFMVLYQQLSAAELNWNRHCQNIDIDQIIYDCAQSNAQNVCLSESIPWQSTGTKFSQQTIGHIFYEAVEINGAKPGFIKGVLQGVTGCNNHDTGAKTLNKSFEFNQQATHSLGSIPAGKAQVSLELNASNQAKLELYDGNTALISADSGLLNGSQNTAIDYHGMQISHSGYGGDGDATVRISGITPHDLQLQLVGSLPSNIKLKYQWGLDPTLGTINISNQSIFNQLASRSAVPGAIGIKELKFLIKNIDSGFPSLYFINSNNVPLHIDFVYDVLNWYPDLNYNDANRAFNSSTYFLDERTHLAGSILAHENYIDAASGTKGLYTIQLWPTDPVPAELILKAHDLIKSNMPVANDKLAYFPASETQSLIYQASVNDFSSQQVGVIDSETLYSNVDYTALNLGEGYGTLKIIREGDAIPSVNDIAIFTYIPNDLAHVSGIITDTPQTPLSHINLKAKQNNTPNAYIKEATSQPEILALEDRLVHYQVNHDGFVISAATQNQVDHWLESVRPDNTQIPASDLSVTEPTPLSALQHGDWISFGAKAANVAELAHVLDSGTYPTGYAIPFSMYDSFMRLKRCQGFNDDGVTSDNNYQKLCADPNDASGKSLYQQIQSIMSDEAFVNSPDVRYAQLKAFRKEVRKSEVPAEMSEKLESIRYFWDQDGLFTHSIRLRSSTNNEDLNGFNGAGLYESNTHHPDEGDIAESVKKVWASLWTSRAFEERRFYRIDHFKTYMGVLAHLSYGDEQVNGVAVTKNIYDRNWEGYYVNAQYGEISVTNPEPIITNDGEASSIPDEFLLTRLVASSTSYQWIQQYIRQSNVEYVYGQPIPTEHVLLDDEVTELRVAMQRIQSHFKDIYAGDEDFAMDIEFKITKTDDGSRGHLEIKQARPWVD